MTDHSVTDLNNTKTHSSNTNNGVAKIAIIGGGLTGLFTATLLERTFGQQADPSDPQKLPPQITVFEKSRSVGRLATRYRTDEQSDKNWQWAFGAQFFTAKSDSFSQFIEPWLGTGMLQPWCAQVVNLTPATEDAQPIINKKEQWDTTHARYISTPKMTSWGRALADDLQLTRVTFKTCVAPLSASKTHQLQEYSTHKKTELFDTEGDSLGWFDWVICTAPNDQAVALMANSNFSEQAKITEPQMQACYTLMLGWDSVQQLPATFSRHLTNATNVVLPGWDVAYMHGSILDRVFVEHHKPGHGDLSPSVTIHARNDWSQVHVDDDIETVRSQLLAAAQQALNWNNDTAPSQIDCHRWRYAATVVTDTNKEQGILVDDNQQWIVSGDWCGRGNIESCYQAAEQTVKVMMATLSQ
ncbi:renalase [Psychrobacter sp. PL15]|uniref:NAD(P)/FAD-dependent oxidoreductase n=1 Tax=Psychrobacter sp. PL15 TaxID=3071719 RepID=UPI002E02B27C|nr:renalase [Psychrobacter sp. PL15]